MPQQDAKSPDACRIWIQDAVTKWPGVDYVFFGWEQAPTTGGWHAQGYVHFEKKVRFTALKKIDAKVSWRAARADWECNWTYCTKNDGEPFVLGDLPDAKDNGAREKSRFEDAWDKGVNNRIDEVAADIRLRYYAALKNIARDHQKKPANLEHYTSEWIVGPSGCGKSSLARLENPDHYPKEPSKWWCGYQGEPVALLEDLDPDQCKYIARHLKLWMDKFAFVGENKGGSMQIRPEKIVITSQYEIDECFNERDAAAIKRRCIQRRMENFKVVEVVAQAQPKKGVPGTSERFVTAGTDPTGQSQAPEWVQATEEAFEKAQREGSLKRAKVEEEEELGE